MDESAAAWRAVVHALLLIMGRKASGEAGLLDSGCLGAFPAFDTFLMRTGGVVGAQFAYLRT
jgi:hypothetical protein